MEEEGEEEVAFAKPSLSDAGGRGSAVRKEVAEQQQTQREKKQSMSEKEGEVGR